MTQDILVVAEHLKGSFEDTTFELLAVARKVAAQTGGRIVVALIGGEPSMCSELGAAGKVVNVTGEAVVNFNPESHGAALDAVFEAVKPRMTMVGYTSMGMDLASTLAVKKEIPHAAFCVEVDVSGTINAVSQLYGGKMNVTSDLGEGPCIVSMLPGTASPDDGRVSGNPPVEQIEVPETDGKVRFSRLIEAESGDVDITAKEVLVAVGRGIGGKDDIEVAEELAEALDAAVAGSRPLIDAGWLPKSRQVGKSGLKVAPKVYIALGISGAPEHLEGMKSSGTIIAINTDKNAPIFAVAHYGLNEDLFDVCEELTEAINER